MVFVAKHFRHKDTKMIFIKQFFVTQVVQVHGSKFKVSDLAYRNNRMNFAFASELKPWQVMFICRVRNLQGHSACLLPTKKEILNP